MLLPGSPASPVGPGGPLAPGIPIRPGSPKDIINVNETEVTDVHFKLGCPEAFSIYCIVTANWPSPASVSGRGTSMTEEFCREVTLSQVYSLLHYVSSMLTWWLYSFETARSQNMNLLLSFSHSFYKSTSCQIRKYLHFYLKASPYLFHLAVHHDQLVLFKERDCQGLLKQYHSCPILLLSEAQPQT